LLLLRSRRGRRRDCRGFLRLARLGGMACRRASMAAVAGP